MVKMLRDGASYNHREVVDLLVEFSSFKDRVQKKFKELARELDGKNNEHELWVNLYLISTDYAEEQNIRKQKQETMQKVS
ncbi:MAG: hypothetical protein IMW93_04220 [Thermoanaerobacteraceae bacterium]|uniref:Uncharacterized protein n=1 Tax=Desulfofundulus thermobenzoicus TaxID=29376 RepID=A0A6N7ISC9_9FIRM|nr:hypothetical protein [Thermoanaerobacteraceae bacterium]MQL52357.1 hypothetical protein [Desulfofundulus thermobenzoicus]HHW42538.1 hypothetical protein [Desulfotomaculum sp.]